MTSLQEKTGVKPMMTLLFASAALIVSCEPMYSYTFYLDNTLNTTIQATLAVKNGGNQYTIDTFAIAAKTDTCIYADENWGTVRNIASPSDSVPAYTTINNLCIYVNDSLRYQQSPIDFSKWQHTGVSTGPGKSQYTFVVDQSIVNLAN